MVLDDCRSLRARGPALVDAALAGFDLGEVVTIPPLADGGEWDRYEGARRAMADHLSSSTPADRYRRVADRGEVMAI